MIFFFILIYIQKLTCRLSFRYPLLVSSPDALYIAPLLTILHKIPSTRRFLLNDGIDVVSDYGYSPDWWKGDVIDLELDIESQNPSIVRMMIETQRIMAFLDGQSRRPYASVKAIFSSVSDRLIRNYLKGDSSQHNPVGIYLLQLVSFLDEDSPLRNTFETVATKLNDVTTRNLDSIDENDPLMVQQTKFTNFLVDVSPAFSNENIYELLDNLLWPTTGIPSAYLSKLSDVITISLKRDDAQSGAGIDIPLLFYPDRYTKPVLPYIQKLYELKKKGREIINQSSKTVRNLSFYRGSDSVRLLDATKSYLEDLRTKHEDDKMDSSDDEDNDEDSDDDISLKELENAIEDVTSALSDLSSKKEELASEAEHQKNMIKAQESLFKGQDDHHLFKMVFGEESYNAETGLDLSRYPTRFRPFRLSGVILSPSEYFFCVRTKPDDIPDMIAIDDEIDDIPRSQNEDDVKMADDDNNDEDYPRETYSEGVESSSTIATNSDDSNRTAVSISQTLYQWYHVRPQNYTTSPEDPPVSVPIDVPEVLRLAKEGSKIYSAQEVILIYALEEDAWSESKHSISLSHGLQEFVDMDKQQLVHEILQFEKQTKERESANSPSTNDNRRQGATSFRLNNSLEEDDENIHPSDGIINGSDELFTVSSDDEGNFGTIGKGSTSFGKQQQKSNNNPFSKSSSPSSINNDKVTDDANRLAEDTTTKIDLIDLDDSSSGTISSTGTTKQMSNLNDDNNK